METKRVLVLIASGSEEMEAVICIDVLRRAKFDVVVARTDGSAETHVLCTRGVRLLADCELKDAKGPWDCIVLPGGGPGAAFFAMSDEVGDVLRKQEGDGKWIAAICAAPKALAAHGIFKGAAMTSYPSIRKDIEKHGKYKEDRVVVDGKLITSRGPGTAFEWALEIIKQLADSNAADKVREAMLL